MAGLDSKIPAPLITSIPTRPSHADNYKMSNFNLPQPAADAVEWLRKREPDIDVTLYPALILLGFREPSHPVRSTSNAHSGCRAFDQPTSGRRLW